MGYMIYTVWLFCLIIYCDGLTCRTDGGRKEEELKSVYKACVKKQEGRNNSDSHRSSSFEDWKDSKRQRPGVRWGKREDQMKRDERTYDRYDRMGNNDDRMESNERINSRDHMMRDRNDQSENRYNSANNRNNGRNYGYNYEDRDGIMGQNDYRMNNRNQMGNDRTNKNGYDHSDEWNDGGGMPRVNTYQSSSQQSRRFKRDKRLEQNSGHRSQYNPNTSSKTIKRNDDQTERKNASNNTKNKNATDDTENKACAIHCFIEELEMTGDNGMPDRYLVTHALTKDVHNEDLKDFLQESIDECFQILYNENTDDKCEFSVGLLTCLSEKGRANCDDWKDDIRF